ncbi:MAG: AbrB/MazE/SpoVT family DNA-binding domain-containing protein [Gammaproteobacteria bacterium]|nr:AbrB/MazE/SpoVT family DNA-binding domain-containing protein [Gammaproteobacteria bacterium]MDE0284636.1 AbrB/MazE/SpoVT family DNA-binding domain-containing protein [Gammaproteobacteria bacterium]MDE0512442.1 AbrB/MazE/SpoVT family DNA-binding domain-containing protein [Gammaproteobacteria bacterium]
MTTLNSRVFMNGNSQAVRIPQEFRLSTSQVEITRNKDGDLVIHAIPENRGTALLDALSAFDDDFIEILEENYRTQPTMQEREDL